MKIYRPMLFLGLGGTGCRVGAELERRMREELCGPDGTRLLRQVQGANYLPYQLPSCLQFVYADLSADELSKVRREVVPGREHQAAAQRTMRLMTNLVPADLSNSSHASQRLALNLDDHVVGWLPPRETDPNVGPLLRGAGQLPTVGRAVLFETLRRNPATAVQGLRDALKDINESAGDLSMVSEGASTRVDQIDVFVTFSVAGGTGAGIFYDYLHLIGEVLEDKAVQLYPLVLMPSAFDEGQGGGRPAELNAGSALIDLFRLVDNQNAQSAKDSFGVGADNGALGVQFPPPRGAVRLRASTIQTAFLFGRPVGGVDRDSLGRSMVSLMLSLIGAGPNAQGNASGATAGRDTQTFADGFINSAVLRHSMADTGIGRRGVSTSSVAELTTPLQELTDIISSRLLAAAVDQLVEPPGGAERNSENILRFLMASGLDKLRHAQPVQLADQEFPAGHDAILKALAARGRAMSRMIEERPGQLREPLANLARNFNPGAGAEAVLRTGADLFRLQRVVHGHREMAEKIDKGGFAEILEGYRYPPGAPPGFNIAGPPQPQGLPKKKFFSTLRWEDPAVQAIVRQQDSWYAWRTRQVWNTEWEASYKLWDRIWRGFVAELDAMLLPLRQHAKADPQLFDARAKDLYKQRVGVSYLLPPQDRGMTGFYQSVLARLKEEYSTDLPAYAREGDLLNQIVDHAQWATAYTAGRENPESAMAQVYQHVKEAVTQVLRPDDARRPALIPSMEDLLANAVGKADRKVSDDDLRQFRQKLAALVPGGYAPAGKSDLQVLFTYPAKEKVDEIERFLRREVALPPDTVGEPVFRAINADSMVVVLMRSSMGITEVPEVRRVLKLWSEAQRNELPYDSLAWRRRLRPTPGYLLMTPDDKERMLYKLLSAAWNGKVAVDGPITSPRSITVRLGLGQNAATMRLDLEPLGALSSWASLLRAFERFILDDDDPVRRNLAENLMSEHPDESTDTGAAVFMAFTGLREGEVKKVAEARRNELLRQDPRLVVVEDFWDVAVPAALNRPIGDTGKTLGILPALVHAAQQLGP